MVALLPQQLSDGHAAFGDAKGLGLHRIAQPPLVTCLWMARSPSYSSWSDALYAVVEGYRRTQSLGHEVLMSLGLVGWATLAAAA